MAEPLSDAVQGLLAAFHAEQERIARVEAERQSLAALERLIAGMKTALADPSALEAKIALNSALDAVQILTSRFDTLLTTRDAIGAADGAVAAAQGLLAGDSLTAAQQLQLLARFLGGLTDVLKIPGVGPLLAFYVKAIESIVQFVPVVEARAQEAARAAHEGLDYLATGREPSAAELEMQRNLDEQLEGIAGREGALDTEEEAARTEAAALRTQLLAQGIDDPEHTYSTRHQEVRSVVREALEASGLLTALIALAGTPEIEVPAELSESRAARTRLDRETGQLTTAERGQLRERAAAYHQWMRERPTGHSAAYESAEAERDAAWERFTRTVREAAATGNWDESDRRSINGTLYELRDTPGWAPFREVLQWDAARDGGPDDAWRASEESSAADQAKPFGLGPTENEERNRRAVAAMDRREQVGERVDAEGDNRRWDQATESYVSAERGDDDRASEAETEEQSDNGAPPVGIPAGFVRQMVEHRVRTGLAAAGVTLLVVAASAFALLGSAGSGDDTSGGSPSNPATAGSPSAPGAGVSATAAPTTGTPTTGVAATPEPTVAPTEAPHPVAALVGTHSGDLHFTPRPGSPSSTAFTAPFVITIAAEPDGSFSIQLVQQPSDQVSTGRFSERAATFLAHGNGPGYDETYVGGVRRGADGRLEVIATTWGGSALISSDDPDLVVGLSGASVVRGAIDVARSAEVYAGFGSGDAPAGGGSIEDLQAVADEMHGPSADPGSAGPLGWLSTVVGQFVRSDG